MPSAKFIVITADIVASRREQNVAAHIQQGLARVNGRHHEHLAAKLNLFRGDEIQGVLRREGSPARLLRHLRFFLWPLKLRAGVGVGRVDSGLDREFSWQMDGSAFHFAREALEGLKKSREPSTRFAGEIPAPEALNVLYVLVDHLQARWSEKQWQAIDAYEQAGTFAKAARQLNITPQNVNKRCLAAGWKAVAAAEAYLDSALKEGTC